MDTLPHFCMGCHNLDEVGGERPWEARSLSHWQAGFPLESWPGLLFNSGPMQTGKFQGANLESYAQLNFSSCLLLTRRCCVHRAGRRAGLATAGAFPGYLHILSLPAPVCVCKPSACRLDFSNWATHLHVSKKRTELPSFGCFSFSKLSTEGHFYQKDDVDLLFLEITSSDK